jgi:hypothetical protein
LKINTFREDFGWLYYKLYTLIRKPHYKWVVEVVEPPPAENQADVKAMEAAALVVAIA